MSSQSIITANAKAFSSEPARPYSFLVEGDQVRVYDSIAGYYTSCHSLSRAAIRRIAALAKGGAL